MVEPRPLGKISSSQHPSVHDHFAKAKADVPGPGNYDTPDTKDWALPEGGRVSRNPPVERFKPFDEYPSPPPGAYGIPNDPTRPSQASGQFSKQPRVSEYIMNDVNRSKSIPGPGAHDVLEAMESQKPFCPEGGRGMMAVKPKGYFEVAPTLTSGNPAPDAYTLPGAIDANRAAGRLVYKYESATMGETRDMSPGLQEKPTKLPGQEPMTYLRRGQQAVVYHQSKDVRFLQCRTHLLTIVGQTMRESTPCRPECCSEIQQIRSLALASAGEPVVAVRARARTRDHSRAMQ
jgi:hypothetical protein